MDLTIHLTEQQPEALCATAEREGRSAPEAAVEAINRYTLERTRRRDEIIARIIVEDREILDRLA